MKKEMTDEEQEFYDYLHDFGNSPLLRILMDKSEIKIANRLAKRGLICKGISDDVQKTVQFSVW